MQENIIQNRFKNEQPKVAIIILNWNGKEDTIECLESLKHITYPNYEILLVDNGSTDGSVGCFRERYPGMEIIENGENLGFAEGNNVGIRRAMDDGADYVLLLNNDTVVDPEFLGELVKVAESDPKIGIVGPIIYYYDEPSKIQYGGGKVNWWIGRPYHCLIDEIEDDKLGSMSTEVDFVTGCCILINIKIGNNIFFDEKYFAYFEDADLCVRLQREGYKLICNKSSKIWHKVSKSSNLHSDFYNYYFARNRLIFMKKNSSFKYYFVFYPYQIVIKTIGALIFDMINRRGGGFFRSYLKGIFDGLRYKS
jgi:GT2 family glycosyltransferase